MRFAARDLQFALVRQIRACCSLTPKTHYQICAVSCSSPPTFHMSSSKKQADHRKPPGAAHFLQNSCSPLSHLNPLSRPFTAVLRISIRSQKTPPLQNETEGGKYACVLYKCRHGCCVPHFVPSPAIKKVCSQVVKKKVVTKGRLPWNASRMTLGSYCNDTQSERQRMRLKPVF